MPDHFLQTYLADRDAPCPSCNYNLRALTTSRCPECNQELQLQIGLVEPKLGAFIAGVVGIALPLGFCALLLLWVVYMYFGRAGWMPPLRDFIPLFLGVVFNSALLTIWMRTRRGLRRLDPPKRWFRVTLAITLAAICPVWFMSVAR